jgi:hypothetical protein
MTWRDILTPERCRRLEQIERYEDKIGGGYKLDSDQYLICDMAKLFDMKERQHQVFIDAYTPWWIKLIQRQSRHAYTCRLFKRIDFVILWLMFKRPYWKNGRLFTKHWEAATIFPVSWYHWAADMQNKYFWTRLILNL